MAQAISSVIRTSARSMSFVVTVSVSKELILWFLGLMIDMFNNGVGVVVVLVMNGYVDYVFFMMITSESTRTTQDSDSSNENSTDL